MLTNKITGFSADLLNTVRGILGEAKKCPADCECEKCEAEDEDEKEMKEGSMPTADEPTDANKKTADKVRAMLAKEKKPVKEEIDADLEAELKATRQTTKSIRGHSRGAMGRAVMKKERNLAQARMDRAARGEMKKEEAKEDLPFEGPYRKTGDRKDEYGNKVKNVAKHLAKKAMKANEEVEHTNCGTPECCGQCDTAEQIDEATAKIVAHLQKRYGDNIRKSHVRSAASDFGVDASKLAKAVRTKLGKTSLAEDEQIDEVSKATLGRYINKAKDSIDTASYRQGHKEAHGSSSKPLEKKLTKRHKGISTAVGKLTKEDAEQVEEAVHRFGSEKSKFDSGHRAKLMNPDGKLSYLSQKSYKTAEHAKEAAKFYHSVAHLPMRAIDNRMSQYNKDYDAKHKMAEEVEQIDELSKATLGSYVKKATNQAFSRGYSGGAMMVRGDMNRDSEEEKAGEKNVHKAIKRVSGVTKATNKLTKEEQDFIDSLNDADMEQIDELSKDAMLKYLSANKKSGARGGRDTIKRMRGADMAVRKYTARDNKYVRVPATEEVELDEARGRPKKAGAKDFTIHPKTKEKLMHNNPEHMAKIERLQKNKVLDKPKVEAGQHIMNQLSKAKTSMLGGSTIHFTHGDSKHVSGVHAAKLLTKYAGMKPSEKEDFQKKIGHSHEQLMKHV